MLLPNAKAEQTSAYYLTSSNPAVESVSGSGRNLTATIDTDTGLLSSALSPSFTILTNSPQTYTLTMSATNTTSGGTTNAIFAIGTTRYIVLTNNTVLPNTASVNNITSGSPTALNNPNAIAYQVNNPTTTTGLTATYNTTNKNWLLTLNRAGATNTSLVVPAAIPLTNTFSSMDEAGDYKATVTLSFN